MVLFCKSGPRRWFVFRVEMKRRKWRSYFPTGVYTDTSFFHRERSVHVAIAVLLALSKLICFILLPGIRPSVRTSTDHRTKFSRAVPSTSYRHALPHEPLLSYCGRWILRIALGTCHGASQFKPINEFSRGNDERNEWRDKCAMLAGFIVALWIRMGQK